MERTIELRKFREAIETIDNDDHRTLIELAYLGAFRESELVAKYEQKKILKGWSKPYGNFLRWQKWMYKTPDGRQEPILLISSAVAKRTKINKEALEQAVESQDPKTIEAALTRFRLFDILAKWKKGELQLTPKFVAQITGKIYEKTIPIPINPKYEPWSKDIIQYILRNGVLRFDITDGMARSIARKYLKKLFGDWFRFHSLRHIRISHLIQYYNFDPYEISTFAGWSFRTAFAGMGIQASPMLDIYAHLSLNRIVAKLLVPLEDLLKL